MRILLDTNVLLRMAVPLHPFNKTATKAVEILHTAGHALFIVPQNIYEFWTAATRTVAHNGLGLSPADAERGRWHCLNQVPKSGATAVSAVLF